jgi:hypothetical protein
VKAVAISEALACYANRAGREQVALDHLRRALELDAALVSEWAAGDDDVASIREPAGIAPA